MEKLERKNLMTFGVNAASKLKDPRNKYANNDQAKIVLGCVGKALKEDRAERNLVDDDEPTAESIMVVHLGHFDKAGCNLTQRRPETEEKPLPKLWLNPITQQPLPAPKSPDERAILAKHDPQLLELLDEMEARPYATTLRLRQAEEKREMLKKISYSETEHLANPWRTGNRKLQDEIVRRGPPELVAFYQREARDIELPLFGPNRNLTILGKIARDYPDTWELIQRAEKIHAQWTAEDKAAAEQARQRAEAELRRLETVA